MKKILLKYLNLYVLSGLLLVGFAGCSDDKDNDPVNPGPGCGGIAFHRYLFIPGGSEQDRVR